MNQLPLQSKNRQRSYPGIFKKCIVAFAFLCLGYTSQAQFHQNLNFRAFNNNVVDCNTQSAVFESTTAYSVEVLVKFNLFTLWGNVFCKRTNQSARDIVLQSYSTNGKMGVAVGDGYGYTSTMLLPGVWYHLAVVYDGNNLTDSTRLKLFINGVQDSLSFLGGGGNTVPSVSPAATGSRFVIGAEYSGTAPINASTFVLVPFDGTVDELRIWNHARTQADIVAGLNTELTLPQSNLAAYYQFNQGTACGSNSSQTTVTDATGGFNGTAWHFTLNGTTSNFTTVVDTSVSVNANQLIAQANPASYQWFDCTSQSTIPGQTTNSFTPSGNGIYSVIVTQDLCIDTSACTNFVYVGIHDPRAAGGMRVFPNPAKSFLTIELNRERHIVIVDAYGKMVVEKSFEDTPDAEQVLDISFLASGIYFIKSGRQLTKFVKE